MKKTIALKDNYSVEIISDLFEKNISVQLIDEVNNINTILATWFKGRWNYDSYVGISKFFEITKKYPKVKRAVKTSFISLKDSNTDPTRTVSKTWNCFCRRVNVKIHNIIK
jgi:hypothetical protein